LCCAVTIYPPACPRIGRGLLTAFGTQLSQSRTLRAPACFIRHQSPMCRGRTQVHENVLLLRFVRVGVRIGMGIGLGFDSDTEPDPKSFLDSGREFSEQIQEPKERVKSLRNLRDIRRIDRLYEAD
jgi:hypothetical protein